MNLHRLTFLAALLMVPTSHADPPTVLVEAEAFENPGGWVNDSQFMDQMSSPFLLAHGLGHPVEDAEATVVVLSEMLAA